MTKILGTPRYAGCVQKIVDKACKEAEMYVKNNVVSSVLKENCNTIK